ncbi:hypothetical protein [Algibacter pacificus]|uniref:hypothetical protein n=1 Tax=Algibacter pacificus TaxID=2599389 RepID=UPI0011CBD41E|nr:hypothetical protein [Algibacter pacificus]
MKILKTTLFVLLFATTNLYAQYTKEEIKKHPCIIGSTAFVLLNFIPDNESPSFVQLNLGYRINTKNVIALELKQWRYYEPIGIPWGPLKTDPKENFPGYVKEKGFAIVYQRFLWNGLYTAVHVMSAWQDFINQNNKKIDRGFQIFNTYRIGYHIKFFKKRFFIEPSLAITHRPYHTKMPIGFKQQDDKWSKLFFAEPGLHVGFNF